MQFPLPPKSLPGFFFFSYPSGIFKCHPIYFRVYFLHHFNFMNFMFKSYPMRPK